MQYCIIHPCWLYKQRFQGWSWHSKLFIDGLYFKCWSMQLSSALDIDGILRNETILALQGRRLDPISALRQAEDIFDYSGALLTPNNAVFWLVWFLGRNLHYHHRVYIPIPDSLRVHVVWDRSRLLGDLELSEGRFIEMELTIVKLWEHWF